MSKKINVLVVGVDKKNIGSLAHHLAKEHMEQSTLNFICVKDMSEALDKTKHFNIDLMLNNDGIIDVDKLTKLNSETHDYTQDQWKGGQPNCLHRNRRKRGVNRSK